MDASKEFNTELKAEINQTFADLYKGIGNNRQQLSNKVLSIHKELTKELNRETVSEDRKKQILAEVVRTVKMAAQQLPHLNARVAKSDAPAAPKPASAPAPKPTPAPKVTKAPKAAAPKPATPKKETPAPKAKATPAKAEPAVKKSTKNVPAKKKK